MLILGSFSWWNSFSLPFAKADRHLIAIIPGDIAGNEFTVHTYGLAWDSIFLGLHSCSSLQLIPFFNMNVCYVIRCTYPSFRMYIHLLSSRTADSWGCTYPSFRMYIHPQLSQDSWGEVVLTHLSECISILTFQYPNGWQLYLPIFQNVYPSWCSYHSK